MILEDLPSPVRDGAIDSEKDTIKYTLEIISSLCILMTSTSSDNNIKFETISQTVIDAAVKASAQLKQKTPPPSILVVENESNSTLVVASYNGQLGIYCIANGDSRILHLVPLDKYRALLFDECQNVHVVILSKLLKCSFVRSSGCSVLLRISLIGALEFFKCKQSDVTLEESPNLVQVNSCDRIRFFHGADCLRPVLYVINLSVDISCAQGDNEIILVNTFDNLLNQRVVTVQTNNNIPPILAGGTLPVYIQNISQMLFWG